MAAEGEELPLEDYLGHGEKILVVDDEDRQREIASGMLTELGYNAESVSSGEDAIEHVKEHPVDLIVLDMVMPKGINGRKTYEGDYKDPTRAESNHSEWICQDKGSGQSPRVRSRKIHKKAVYPVKGRGCC